AESIVMGVILTVLVILLFLGDWRGAVIAAIVIPTAIISTFFPMAQQDFSINMMTLLAFGTCLGTLIANALLIIENVYKHLGMGKDPEKATVDGTKEVLLAVIAGAGTNLVVFTPIAMMGGIIGKFFVQFGLTVVYATLFSIVASISLTPMLCAKLLKRMDQLDNPLIRFSKKVDAFLMKIMDFFKGFFDFQMKRPLIALLLTGAFFLSIVYPVSKTGGEFIPRSDRNEFTVEVVMPDGTPVEKTTEIVKIVESFVKDYPEVKSYYSDIGYSGEERARVSVNLVKFVERNRTYEDLINDLIPKVANIPEADIFVSGGNKSSDGLGDITVDIRGVEMDEMTKVAVEFERIMNETGYFSAVQSSYINPKLEVQFQGDPAAIIQQKLNNAQVGTVIRALVNGDDDSVYKELGEEYDINVTLDKGFKKSPEDFSQFLIHGKDGLIPIVSVGDVKQVIASSPLKRRDKSKIIQLNGYLSKGTAGLVMSELSEAFSKVDIPNGVTFVYSGRAENQAEAGAEIGQAFLLAVILTYMLLVAVLNSFVFPVSIASCIVTSFLGVFVMMFFLEGSINIGSMMAFVMVVGLAVNNAILMIEYAQQLIEQGRKFEDALWTAAREKFKPILMTSIAIIAGSWPQIFDPDKMKSSMGSVVIGGMIGSVIFTYIMTPSVHILLLRIMSKIKRKKVSDVPEIPSEVKA
ncbi:MAG TPA: efflux RND transporter permease subunit, partial [Bacteriovoracaceae bacterium]|nr:efflux RND transporter permease subunit [Bacteriovoracaceae bacterium]